MSELAGLLFADTPEAEVTKNLILPYLNHAAHLVEIDYANPAEIDAAMRYGCGYSQGPMAMIDQLGAGAVAQGLNDLYLRTGDGLHRPAEILTRAAAGEDVIGATDVQEPVRPEFKHHIKSVGVVGTGTMATGIVEVFARAGYEVVYIGRSDEKTDAVANRVERNLDKAVAKNKLSADEKSSITERLIASTQREALGDADLVIEAIAEDLTVKEKLFSDLDRICKPGAVLATTTSSLPVNSCAAATRRAADVIGMHFFNPATIMKLVEVVSTSDTRTDVIDTIVALCWQIGKHPVGCGDRAGFIVNALLFPYLNDAIKWHEEHGTAVVTIDQAVKDNAGMPMGPFELLDVVGNDVSLAIQQTLVKEYGHPRWQPAGLLEMYVDQGRLGRKSGRGFHDYY